MKILFICHRIPFPPNKGDKVRAFNMIKHLSKRHDIYLVSLYDDKTEKEFKAHLVQYCKEVYLFYINRLFARARVIFCLFTGQPATLGYFYSRKMESKINTLIKTGSFDLIFAYSSSMAQYIIDYKVKKIMDFVDCDSAKWEQYSKITKFPFSSIYHREHVLLRRYEGQIAQIFDKLLVSTQLEKEEFGKFTGTGKFNVIVNGVDTDYFKPASVSKTKKLIFTGTMDYFANIDGVTYFCKEIFPLVKEKNPDAQFYIVGSRPTASVRALSRIKGVIVTGQVSDIRTYLRDAAVSVISLRIAQGIQNKILEAMASGIPVVASSNVLLGLNAQPDKDLLIAYTPEEFAEKINLLLIDANLRTKVAETGRKYVENNHNWAHNLSTIDKLMEEYERGSEKVPAPANIRDYYRDEKVAQSYDSERFASFSGNIFNYLEKRCISKLIRFVRKATKISNVLDIPAGTGRITQLLAEQGFNVFAADISQEMIKVAQAKLYQFRNIKYQIMDIKKLPYADEYFDCVTCIRLFHHLDSNDRVEILKELARVTKKYLIINIPYSSKWYKIRRKFKRMLRQGFSRVAVTNEQMIADFNKCDLVEAKREFVMPLISEDMVIALEKYSKNLI